GETWWSGLRQWQRGRPRFAAAGVGRSNCPLSAPGLNAPRWHSWQRLAILQHVHCPAFRGIEMNAPLHHANERSSNTVRETLAALEPRALRTYTPSQAVLARSSGIFHWTPEGRRLYDFTSGVLVSNLGHNPVRWQQRLAKYMGWSTTGEPQGNGQSTGF